VSREVGKNGVSRGISLLTETGDREMATLRRDPEAQSEVEDRSLASAVLPTAFRPILADW